MLRFFRRIRQRLLTDNKFGKYLLYAVGEILLVVIGILIALQVNNWNETRLERKEEIEILKGVRKDLLNNIDEFRFLNGIREKILYGTREIFRMSASGAIQKERLDSLIGLTFYRPTFNNKQGAIDLLFSSAKINLIQNDSIRELLLTWPGSVDDMTEEEGYASQTFVDHYYPVVAQYAVIDEVIEHVLSRSLIGPEIREETYENLPLESDYSALMRNREFLNHLRARASHIGITREEVNELIRQADSLIAMIDAEIEN